MQPEEVTFNRNTVGRAGIAWAIVQFFSIPLGFIVLYVGMYVLTPPVLVLLAWDKLSMIFSFLPRSPVTVFFVSGLVLLLLIIGLTIGVYRRSFVCAILLLIDVAGYFIIAVYGLLFVKTFTDSLSFFMYTVKVNTIYIGIMLIILLFIAGGIWGRSSRTSKLVKITAPIILVLGISIPVIIAWVFSTQLGSISGNIYQPDGTIVTSEADIFCKPPPGVHITHGDPAPPYLIVRATGNYKIDDLPEGDYYLWVVAPDDNLFSDGFRLVSVQASQENSNIDFKLVPGGSISGHFLDKNGNPVSDAGGNKWVAMYSLPVGWHYTIYVAPDGTYSQKNLLPAEYQIYSNLIQRQPFDTVTIESGKETQYDFSIRK